MNIWTVIGWHARLEVPSCLKRGDQRMCIFYRWITLISLHEKIYTRILERRIPLLVEAQSQEQCELNESSCGSKTIWQVYTLYKLYKLSEDLK